MYASDGHDKPVHAGVRHGGHVASEAGGIQALQTLRRDADQVVPDFHASADCHGGVHMARD